LPKHLASFRGRVTLKKEDAMGESTYKIIEVVGTSTESWEDAAKTAIATAAKSLKDLRIAEVVRLDVMVEEGKAVLFRTRLNLSFKYHEGD